MRDVWTIKSLLEWTAGYFGRKNLDNPRLEAELLLAHVLGTDRVGLYVNYHQPVNQEERACYRELVKRRVKGEPVAYLTGRKEFFSLDFEVTPEVLIPRSDTEAMVEKAVALGRATGGPINIADVGTGSGAIAVTLAVHLPHARIFAIDISPSSVEVAARNAARHQVQERVEFLVGDLLSPLEASDKMLDMVIANLPYIPTLEWENLASEVRDFEPRSALDGGEDGLIYYRRLLPQARKRLRRGGYILVEIGWNQGQAMRNLMKDYFDVLEIGQDMAGRDRFIVGKKMG